MKRLPTETELLSWYLFWRLDEVPYVENPQQIAGWIGEFWKNPNAAYLSLYDGYESFRKLFEQPIPVAIKSKRVRKPVKK